MEKEISKLFLTGCEQILNVLGNGDVRYTQLLLQYIKTHIHSLVQPNALGSFYAYAQSALCRTLERKNEGQAYERHMKKLLETFGSDNLLAQEKYMAYYLLRNNPRLAVLSPKTLLCLQIEIAFLVMCPKLTHSIKSFYSLYNFVKQECTIDNNICTMVQIRFNFSEFSKLKVIPVMFYEIAQIVKYHPDVENHPLTKPFCDDVDALIEELLPCIQSSWSQRFLVESPWSPNAIALLNKIMTDYWELGVYVQSKVKKTPGVVQDLCGGGFGSMLAGFFGKLGSKAVASKTAKVAAKESAKVIGKAAKDLSTAATIGLAEKLKDPETYSKNKSNASTSTESVDIDTRLKNMLSQLLDERERAGRGLNDPYASSAPGEILREPVDPVAPATGHFPVAVRPRVSDFVPSTPAEVELVKKEKRDVFQAEEDLKELEFKVRSDHLLGVIKDAKDYKTPVNYGPVQMENLRVLELLNILKLIAVKK